VPVDLNADLGEGFGVWRLGDDDALLEVVTSANVACGFHAGDPATMARVCRRAAERGVTIGAQVSYRDLVGFGRRKMEIDPADLQADVLYQIGALDAFARAADRAVAYVKPHGALYNTAAGNPAVADAVAAAVAAFDPALPLLGLPDSELQHAAGRAGVPFVAEGFADRAYTPDGRLADRRQPGAIHTDPDRVVAQARDLAQHGRVASICLHGDTAGAVELARAVRAALERDGVELAAFAAGSR
jgi:UPF0271 protein